MEANVKSFRDLKVWQKSIDLVEQVYDLTDQFPGDELYSITQQIRRCTVSVPSNIAEGSARNSTNDFIRFLHISKGSLAELETQIIISRRRNYLSQQDSEHINHRIQEIDYMLYRLIERLKAKRA
jgi:four helix bundle protein